MLLAFVVLGQFLQYQAKKLAVKNVSEMTYSVSSGIQNPNSLNLGVCVEHQLGSGRVKVRGFVFAPPCTVGRTGLRFIWRRSWCRGSIYCDRLRCVETTQEWRQSVVVLLLNRPPPSTAPRTPWHARSGLYAQTVHYNRDWPLTRPDPTRPRSFWPADSTAHSDQGPDLRNILRQT